MNDVASLGPVGVLWLEDDGEWPPKWKLNDAAIFYGILILGTSVFLQFFAATKKLRYLEKLFRFLSRSYFYLLLETKMFA